MHLIQMFCFNFKNIIMKNLEKTAHSNPQLNELETVRINDFFNQIQDAILVGFGDRNLSESEIIQSAIDYNGDIFDTEKNDIEYAQVKVSKGTLYMAANARMRYISLVRLTISWKNAIVGKAKDTDIAHLVYYNVSKNIVTIENTAARRINGIIDFKVAKGTMGDDVHCWLFFVSEDGKLRSESSYLMSRRSVY